MIYSFYCEFCDAQEQRERSIREGPPMVLCCGSVMQRDWQADRPHLDTSLCRDHNEVPPEHQIVGQSFDGERTGYVHDHASARSKEHAYQREMADFRRRKREGGIGAMEMVRRVPAELHHGKIKETGDRHYWDDPKNLRKHKDCEV